MIFLRVKFIVQKYYMRHNVTNRSEGKCFGIITMKPGFCYNLQV